MDVPVENIVRYLDSFTLTNLQNRIRAYRRIPLNTATDQEAREAIWNVLAPSQFAAYSPLLGTYPAQTIFWRARTIEQDDHVLPLRAMRNHADVWEPPSECVTAPGRLNKAKESLLYTCPNDAALTVQEVRIPSDQLFSLIKFESIEPVNVVQIMAADTTGWPMTEERRTKYDMLMDFFETEFTRDVGIGSEHLYRSSESIAKDHFDLPPQIQDAWMYPSTVGKPKVNVTFRPEVAHQKLRFLGVALCKWHPVTDGITLEAPAFTDGSLGAWVSSRLTY